MGHTHAGHQEYNRTRLIKASSHALRRGFLVILCTKNHKHIFFLYNRYFAKENVSHESFLSENDHQDASHFLTDEKALEIFKSLTLLASTSDAASLGKPQRNNYVRALRTKGLTIKQIARLMDISATTVKRICKMVH